MVDACENVSKAYGAAGRLVREGSKTYRYGYLDKVMSVTDNGSTYTYEYHADGQLARANYGRADTTPATVGGDHRAPRNAPQSEDFLWDGLALIQRGDEQFVNEPHIGGGNPVASSKGTSYFNDMLGTTVGSKKDGKYSPAVLTAFGESLASQQCEATSNFKHQTSNSQTFFTGKPMVEGLGHAFLMRNYRAGLAKWQSADPMGYPDGWNQLAYCNNGVTSAVDLWGCKWVDVRTWDTNLTAGEWKELSRTAKSDQEILAALFRYGELGWTRPVARSGAEQLIVGPVTTTYENITDFTWYKDTTTSFVYNRVDTLEVAVTTKELKDDPSLVNAFVDLALSFGAHIKGPWGKTIGLISDVNSVSNAIAEIREWIDQYGKDTVWTIDLGTVTYTKTRQCSVGFFRVNE